ncbi:small-subunit processome [Hyaloraphidium curvatum]|nr:small-subunit processome [Hyaloraphidium curvatum]
MSSLRRAVNRRTFKERAQPAARERLGILEKHKDYVQRARDYHRKEKRLKSLKEKAAFKNPDEFYFGMVNSRTNDGVHVGKKQRQNYSVETLKAYKTQDHGYLRYHESVNRAKVRRLEEEVELGLHPDEPEASTLDVPVPRRTVFVDTVDDVEDVDVSSHSRKRRRPAAEMDSDDGASDDGDEEASFRNGPKKPSREERELAARKERDAQLKKLEMEVTIQKSLMGKGTRKKVGEYPNGLPKYKWKNERKK